METTGTLQDVLSCGPVRPDQVLSLALGIVPLLGEAHNAGRFHGRLCPRSISADLSSGKVFLPELHSQDGDGGDLLYMAPEQSGRIAGKADYRSDFYSLGVILYELAFGRLPFDYTGAGELVHAHLSRVPVFLENRGDALFRIIEKLMEKDPDRRYQCCADLLEDLEGARRGRMPPDRRDRRGRLEFPSALFGRKEEADLLRAFLRRAADGAFSFLTLAGAPGVGKTALVREVLQRESRSGGLFISGKFDPLQTKPYEAFRMVVAELVRKTLGQGDEEVRRIRDRLEKTIPFGRSLVLNLFPDARYLLVDNGSPAPGPREASNLLGILVPRFLEAFLSKGVPLVLFLDDLQWADDSSLDLVEKIAAQGTAGLFLVLAVRNREGIDAAMDTTAEIGAASQGHRRLDLPELPFFQVRRFLEEALPVRNQEIIPLAEIVYARSLGNPLFLRFYLRSLVESRRLLFDHLSGTWRWDIREIAAAETGDDVVDFLKDRIDSRFEKDKQALLAASCIGNTFSPDLLAQVVGFPEKEVKNILSSAVEDYLLVRNEGEAGCRYSFLHDRVRQAAYLMVPEERKRELHRKTGLLLLKKNSGLFDVVYHLNNARSLMERPEERHYLADLNLQAAREARASSAFQAAYDCLRTALSLLPEDPWQWNYDFTLSVHTAAAEAALLSFDFEAVETLTGSILGNTRDLLDTVAATEIRIHSLMARHKMIEAFQTAVEALELLGVRIPAKRGDLYTRLLLRGTRRRLAGKIETLKDLPVMQDPRITAAVRILAGVGSSAYIAVPDAFPHVSRVMADLHLRYGRTVFLPLSLAMVANLLCSGKKIAEETARLIDTALSLASAERPRADRQKILFYANAMVEPWLGSLSDTLEPLFDGFMAGREAGDFEYAILCLQFRNLHSLFCCRNLADLRGDMLEVVQTARAFAQKRSVHSTGRLVQFYMNLTGENDGGSFLTGDYFDEERDLLQLRQAEDRCGQGTVFIYKMVLAYLLGDYNGAFLFAETARPYIPALRGEYLVALWTFYRGLTRAASGGRGALALLQKTARRLKVWAMKAPSNYLHTYDLITAEILNIRGKDKAARDAFRRSIAGAEENLFYLDAALARERLAVWYERRGKTPEAEEAFILARDAFLDYGCLVKVREMEERRSFLRTPRKEVSLDADAVIEATRVISGEIVLDRLAERLLSIVMRNSGATRGVLYLSGAEGLAPEASGWLEKGSIRVRCSPEHSDVPGTIVRFVQRTGETVVLRNAAEERPFGDDPYLRQKRVLSVLCIPLIHRNELLGIVYLENDLLPSAFPNERAALAGTIAAQAAVSLENARLYRSLLKDIEARKAAEKELVESREREKEQQRRLLEADKLASLGVLAAGVAHEVSNPNHIVRLNASFLEEAGPDILSLLDEASDGDDSILLGGLEYQAFKERFLHVLSDIRECSERIDAIVQDLKTYARESPDTPRVPLDVNAVVASALRLTYPLTRKATGNFAFVPGEGLPPVFGNALRLEQVVINLVQNACQALTSKDQGVRVETFYDSDGGNVVLSVTDEGRGIPEDQIPKVTDPFFTTRRESGGTGLGLSVSSKIVEEHGGIISVGSPGGQGTCVRVIFPSGEKK